MDADFVDLAVEEGRVDGARANADVEGRVELRAGHTISQVAGTYTVDVEAHLRAFTFGACRIVNARDVSPPADGNPRRVQRNVRVGADCDLERPNVDAFDIERPAALAGAAAFGDDAAVVIDRFRVH